MPSWYGVLPPFRPPLIPARFGQHAYRLACESIASSSSSLHRSSDTLMSSGAPNNEWKSSHTPCHSSGQCTQYFAVLPSVISDSNNLQCTPKGTRFESRAAAPGIRSTMRLTKATSRAKVSRPQEAYMHAFHALHSEDPIGTSFGGPAGEQTPFLSDSVFSLMTRVERLAERNFGSLPDHENSRRVQ